MIDGFKRDQEPEGAGDAAAGRRARLLKRTPPKLHAKKMAM
jgi:hypothetical protein